MFNKIKLRLKNKDNKTLLENFLSLSFLQIAGYVFPIVTLPYLARVIGVEGFGEIAFAASIVMYFQTIADWGFNYTATRDVAKNREDIKYVSYIFTKILVARIILMIICAIIIAILIYSIPYLYERRVILWLTFLYIPGYIMFPEWFFQAMERMKYITILNVLSKLLFTALIFVIIRNKEDYIYQPVLTALGFVVSGLISLWFIFKKFRIILIPINISDVLYEIRKSANMFICLFLPNLYTNLSVILLGSFGSSVITGIYSSGKKFIDLGDQFFNVLSRTFYPFLARRIDKHDLYIKLSGFLSLISCIFLFAGADLLVTIFYTPEFSKSVNIIRIMSLSPIAIFLMNTYGTNYLVLVGKENILRNIITCCSIGGVIITIFSIYYYSYIGAAISVMAIWLIRGILTWRFAIQYKHLNKSR